MEALKPDLTDRVLILDMHWIDRTVQLLLNSLERRYEPEKLERTRRMVTSCRRIGLGHQVPAQQGWVPRDQRVKPSGSVMHSRPRNFGILFACGCGTRAVDL